MFINDLGSVTSSERAKFADLVWEKPKLYGFRKGRTVNKMAYDMHCK